MKLPGPAPRRSLSLEWKLPLLMIATLGGILALSLALSHRTLTRSAEITARERMTTAAQAIAATVSSSVAAIEPRLRQVANAPAMVSLLSADTPDRYTLRQATAELERIARGREPTEVWDASGRPRAWTNGAWNDVSRPSAARLGGDTVWISPMFEHGGVGLFWIARAVRKDGQTLGYVAQVIEMSSPPRAAEDLRMIMGQEVKLSLRNRDSQFWIATPVGPSAPPQRREEGDLGLWYARAGVGRTIAAEAAIAGTPWVAVLETPGQLIFAASRKTTISLLVAKLFLIAIGVLWSWLLSRRITRPLASVARAAEDIAHGQYARRVQVTGGDEIGRLAASFNTMAAEIDASRGLLERRVNQAQEATLEAEQMQREAERARREAERANRAKSDFLAVMSHELRTPLNAIGGYAQLLELGVYGPVTDKQREALARVVRNQSHLLALINDILNYTRLDAGRVQYQMQDVQLADALADLELLIGPQIVARELIFVCRPCNRSLTVHADPDKLQQIMLNLLTNAIKFTPSGGTVLVETDASGEQVGIRVHDTGIGIPGDRLQAVFEPFFQVDRALNRPAEGIGLGLAISRDLARGMGGDLTAASTMGRGSVFTLTLRRGAAAGMEPERATDSALA